MPKDTTVDELQSLFESVTGDTTVVEKQESETGDREIDETADDAAKDAIDHHGFGDVIDNAEPADDAL